MKRLNSALIIQNEAEKVLLIAMSSLLEKIPDVSSEDVDDINEIKYKNFDQTHFICSQAKKRLNRLSSSPNIIRIEKLVDSANGHQTQPMEIEAEANVHFVESVAPVKKVPKKSSKSRVSCPPKFILTGSEQDVPGSPMIIEEESQSHVRLYPCLGNIMQEQPPTYSDSESNYTTVNRTKSPSKVSKTISPSAPSYSEISACYSNNQTLTDVTDHALTPPHDRRGFYNLRKHD